MISPSWKGHFQVTNEVSNFNMSSLVKYCISKLCFQYEYHQKFDVVKIAVRKIWKLETFIFASDVL